MKKIVLVFVSLLMISCLASCNRDEPSNIVNNNVSSVEVSEPFVSVSVTKDANGNILQHILFNKHTKVTYIYDYEWVYDYGAYVCSGSWLTVIDAEGNEVPDEPQVSVNGCTCAGSSGDAYNDIYPGYKVPDCTCKQSNSITNQNEFKECTLFEDKDFGLKLTIVSGVAEDKNVFYKVKVENNSAYDLNIQLWANTINDKLNVDFTALCVNCDSGKMTYTNLEFYNYDLSPYDIEFEDIDKIMFEIHLSSEDFMTKYLEGATSTIEFKEK